MKKVTRGKHIDSEGIKGFIQALEIPDEAKKQLLKLTPEKYTGLAVQLVKAFS
jgi:adenylosuccinate lyase